MSFNSLHFAFFFILILSLVTLTRRNVRRRNWLLLLASYYFYGCWDYRFLSLIIISTLVDYVCGRLFDVRRIDLEHPPVRTRRHRYLVLASVATNLTILGFFKYFDFFVTSAAELLTNLGISAHPTTLNIILPVGISFYTFQTMSYSIDLYRGRVTTEHSLLNFAVYVAFFPQLVAGPIERAWRLLPQVRELRPVTWEMLYTGFYLICWGLFKKVVIADQIATVADNVFGAEEYSGLDVLLGVYAFAVLIYCDFSGYSDIARGAARCLGFDIMLNFNLPYFAVNPSDFWRRWHISLRSWLRDYLYIPLGGNRKGPYRTYVNLMITMILGGLWHGAAWTFILWGIYHGLLLTVHRAMTPWLRRWFNPRNAALASLWFWTRVVVFFHLVCLSWLLFRAESFGQAFDMSRSLVTGFALTLQAIEVPVLEVLLSCLLLFCAVQLTQWFTQDLRFVLRLPVVARTLVYTSGVLGFILFGRYSGETFIYFQF